MKGTLHTTPPPGFLFTEGAAKALGMSPANFHNKYAEALERWCIGSGNGTLLFHAEDVANLARWRTVREGMIALGHWHPSTPGVPSDGDYHIAVHEGYWDVDCPRCGGDGVGVGDGCVWCPECDK